MKVMGITCALAVLLAASVVAAFNMGDERGQAVVPSAPATLQPRAVRTPTGEPVSGAVPETAGNNTTATAPAASAGSPPMLVRLDGDRLMGHAIAQPENAGGTLVLGVTEAPSSLNPLLAGPQPVDSILNAIFEPLAEPHPDTLEAVGVLAESWTVDARGTTWTFNLRQDVTWHDGEPFRSADVVYSLQSYLNADYGHPVAERLQGIVERVEAAGDQAVLVTTNEPYADLPVVLGVLPIFAEHIFGDVPPVYLSVHGGSTGEAPESVVGTGPFRFESRSADGAIRAVANAQYWDGAPVLEELIAQPVASEAEMIELLRAREIDIGRLPAGAAPAFEGLDYRVVDYPLTGFTMLGFNLNTNTTPIFQDVRVRQALLLALDRQDMANEVRFGYADVGPGTLPVNSWASKPDSISTVYPFDPALARQLLDEVGWTTGADGNRAKDGRPLSFKLVTNSENSIRVEYLEHLKEQWSSIGVAAELVVEPFADVQQRLTESGDFDAFLLGYSWGLSPDQSAVWSCAGGRPAENFTGYCNGSVDNLLVRAQRELDSERRAELYLEIQELVLADLPVAILDFPRGLTGIAGHAHNVYPSGVNLYFNVETWWVD